MTVSSEFEGGLGAGSGRSVLTFGTRTLMFKKFIERAAAKASLTNIKFDLDQLA